MNFKTPIGVLRLLAILEGISYLGLFITMPIKYILEEGMPNKIVGMAHGVLFIAYCAMVYYVNTEVKWDKKTNFWAYLASLLPFGTFVADAIIFKAEQQRQSSDK